MNFLIIVEKKPLVKFVEVLGECKKNNQGFYCFDGYLFGITQKELHEAINSKSPELFLCDLTGEFLYVGYNEKSKELLVANDKLGRYLIFKYEDENRVIFSNNFWRLIDFLKQNELEMSIDKEAIKDFLLTGVFLNCKTFFKNVEFLPPASFIKMHFQNGEFRKVFNNYWSFHAENEVNSIEAERELYEAINETIKGIQKRHPKEDFGLGISGGLDSRIALYFANKNSMKIFPFIICDQKPNLIFKARDLVNSEKIVNQHNMNLKVVNPFSEPLEKKIIDDVTFNPIGTSQIFISSRDKIGDFKFLLTGASGFLVGSEIDRVEKNSLANEIFGRLLSTRTYSFSERLLQKVKGHNNFSVIQKAKRIFGKNTVEKSFWKIHKFVENYNGTALETLMQFYIYLASRNRHGAFESNLLRYFDYSIYTTFVLNIINNWKEEYFYGRKILKNLISNISPKLSSIPGQSVFSENNIKNIFLSFEGLLRGSGVQNYSKLMKKRDIRSYFYSEQKKAELNSTVGYLDLNIEIQDLKNYPRLFANLLKTARILKNMNYF